MSLRTRVTMWATMVVAIAMVAASLGLLLGLQQSMWRDRDSTGHQRLADVTSLIRHDRLGSLIPSNGGDADVVEVLNAHGKVRASSDFDTRPGSPSGFPTPSPGRCSRGTPPPSAISTSETGATSAYWPGRSASTAAPPPSSWGCLWPRPSTPCPA
ncbi:hypothetical protein ACFQ10_01740 [Streptomyces indonesiensis]